MRRKLAVTEKTTYLVYSSKNETFVCQDPDCMCKVPDGNKICPGCGKKITHIAVPEEGIVYKINENGATIDYSVYDENDDYSAEEDCNIKIIFSDNTHNCASDKKKKNTPLKLEFQIYNQELIKKALEDGLIISVS